MFAIPAASSPRHLAVAEEGALSEVAGDHQLRPPVEQEGLGRVAVGVLRVDIDPPEPAAVLVGRLGPDVEDVVDAVVGQALGAVAPGELLDHG